MEVYQANELGSRWSKIPDSIIILVDFVHIQWISTEKLNNTTKVAESENKLQLKHIKLGQKTKGKKDSKEIYQQTMHAQLIWWRSKNSQGKI